MDVKYPRTYPTVKIIKEDGDEFVCRFRVTYYDPGERSCYSGHPDNWYPGSDSEIEYELFDDEGNFIDDNEVSLTEKDKNEIECKITDYHTDPC